MHAGEHENPDPIADGEYGEAAPPVAASLPGGSTSGSPTISAVRAVRLVCATGEAQASMVEFYRGILGRDPDDGFGGRDEFQRSSLWRMAEGPDLIITHERDPGPETFLDQGPVWICFETENADGVYDAASERGLELLNDPIDTAFDTRAFFTNDPSGLPIYVGGAWPRAAE